MNGTLLDLNVLLALAWPSHVHHAAAHDWFDSLAGAEFATCPLTQCGFVRLSSNPALSHGAVSPADAIDLLARITAIEGHVFWPDDVDLSTPDLVPAQLLLGHRQVTDAYLLGLAIHNQGKLASFDRGLRALLPPADERQQHLELIPC